MENELQKTKMPRSKNRWRALTMELPVLRPHESWKAENMLCVGCILWQCGFGTTINKLDENRASMCILSEFVLVDGLIFLSWDPCIEYGIRQMSYYGIF